MPGKKATTQLWQAAPVVEYCPRHQKGFRFDSRSGHIPTLWVQSPITVWEATDRWFSFSLFLSLKIIKDIPLGEDLKNKKRQ